MKDSQYQETAAGLNAAVLAAQQQAGLPRDADRGQQSAADFEEATRPGDLWPEAADALCSEHAALFAGTQPGPLTVV